MYMGSLGQYLQNTGVLISSNSDQEVILDSYSDNSAFVLRKQALSSKLIPLLSMSELSGLLWEIVMPF